MTLLTLFACLIAPQASGDPVAKNKLCELKDQDICESSGIDISTRQSGVYWTHNDSGDGPNFYAFDSRGNSLGTYSLKGATAVDWEDMASVKLNNISYLYFADVGDNSSKRPEVVIYRVVEPSASPGKHSIARFDTFRCTYPDGAHNCESLIVFDTGEVQLITKDPRGKGEVYSCRAPNAKSQNKLIRAGEIWAGGPTFSNKLFTGADCDSKTGQVVVRTYYEAYWFKGAPLNAWHRSKPRVVPLPPQPQGEAICFDFGLQRLVLTSEGTPCVVSFAPLPR